MKASETKLQPVLEGSKQYIVPMFQRQYSWRQKQWETLWDDLCELYEAGDNREHFLGAIVTMPVDMQPAGVSKYLLIDGQQRLTTLFVLLSALRDHAARNGELLADRITEQYLINKWAEPGNRYKLLPTQADREGFHAVLSKQTADGPMRKAYRFFGRKLRGRDENNAPFDLTRMHDLIVRQFIVVMIVLAKDENPYLIFESLNAKGQPLTQADLVRNYLFMRISDPEEQRIAYQELWRPMEKTLENELPNFMWRYLTKDGTFVRQGSIYEAIKERLSTLASSEEVIDVLSDMHTYAEYFARLIGKAKEPNLEVRRRLDRLNRWEINTALPFLLALYRDFAREDVSVLELCDVLDAIESFLVRRTFCDIPSNILNRMFIGLYRNLDGTDIVGSLHAHLAARRWPTDDEFREGWRQYGIYQSRTRCRHVLESLEQRLTKNNEPVDVTYSQISIEHIMPQALTADWETELGVMAPETHSRYLHTIGNLTLTGSNSPMGNKTFSEKRKTLKASNFALNDYFAGPERWNEDAIIARADTLLETALGIWRRPPISEAIAKLQDPTGSKPTHFVLFGDTYQATSWREVYLRTLSLLVELHGVNEFMSRAGTVSGTTRQYLAFSKQDMTHANELEGTGIWVETNLGSRSILSLIAKMLEACGHDQNEFEASWE